MGRFCTAPLDVLKIRLQLQIHSLAADPTTPSPTITPKPLATGAGQGQGQGRESGLVDRRSTLRTFETIWRKEGITVPSLITYNFFFGGGRANGSVTDAYVLSVKAFWKGNIPAELLYVTYGAIQFSLYRQISRLLRPFQLPHELEAFVSGALAGSSATAITYPLDLLRTRFAAQGADRIYASLRSSIPDIYRQEGLKGFFQGVGAGVVQVFPYMGLFFSSYEALKLPLAELQLPLGSGDATAGVLASVFAKTGVFPLDVIRKRLQVQGPMRMRYLGGRIPVYGRGVLGTGVAIVSREGWRGLYGGLGVGLIKSAPASAITMWTYERVLNSFRGASLLEDKPV